MNVKNVNNFHANVRNVEDIKMDEETKLNKEVLIKPPAKIFVPREEYVCKECLESLKEGKEVEIPLGEHARVVLRPTKKYPLSQPAIRKIFSYINENIQRVQGTEKTVVLLLPVYLDVVVIKPDGTVEVY